MSSNIQARIKSLIDAKPVAIFMKGTPKAPQCGFSARAVEALYKAGVTDASLTAFDVQSDPELLDALTEYSNWPTTPQIFVHGEFIGGCDIVVEMTENGDFQKKLQK